MPTQQLRDTTKLNCSELKTTPSLVRNLYKNIIYNLQFIFIEKTVNLSENVNPDLLESMREGVPSHLTGIPNRRE